MGKTFEVNCPYCNQPAKLVTGQQIYATLKWLHHKYFWQCLPCHAHVGTHKNSTKNRKPLGALANKETRLWRHRAHSVFDPLWQSGHFSRQLAYELLCNYMSLTWAECHIGLFDVDQCKQVIAFCKRERALIETDKVK